MVDHKIVAVSVDLDRYNRDLGLAAPNDGSKTRVEDIDQAIVTHGRAVGLIKIEPCVKFVEAAMERSEKLVVLVRTGPVLEALCQALAKAGVAHGIIRGSNTIADNIEGAQSFNDGPRPQVLVASMAGLELLQGKTHLGSADRLVFHDLECRLERLQNAVDLTADDCRSSAIIVTHILGRGTTDDQIVAGLRTCYAGIGMSERSAGWITRAQACLDEQLVAAFDYGSTGLDLASAIAM